MFHRGKNYATYQVSETYLYDGTNKKSNDKIWSSYFGKIHLEEII